MEQHFLGNVYCDATYAGSDHLKQNINDFSSAMEIINQLHPKYYEYRHDSHYQLMNLPKGEHYGLIAQDVEKILPGLVKDTKFETRYAKPNTTDAKKSETIYFKALNYTELIPIMIKAMQEQQQQTPAEVTVENEELKSRLNKIEEALALNKERSLIEIPALAYKKLF